MIGLSVNREIFIGKERKFKYLGVLGSYRLPGLPRLGKTEIEEEGAICLEFMNEEDAEGALKFIKIDFPDSTLLRSSWGGKEVEYFTLGSFRSVFYNRVTFDISFNLSQDSLPKFMEILKRIQTDLGYKMSWFLDNGLAIIK